MAAATAPMKSNSGNNAFKVLQKRSIKSVNDVDYAYRIRRSLWLYGMLISWRLEAF